MSVLAFDTATRATAVALCGPGPEASEARDDPPQRERPRHATRLMPLIVELLEAAETDWTDLDRIAVGIGPGTFTGLRIGIATARGLALACGLPLVGVSTLRSLADGGAAHALGDRVRTVAAILDARRGEAYAAAWSASREGSSLTVAGEAPSLTPGAYAPDGLADRLGSLPSPILAVGEGAVEFRVILERAGVVVPEPDCTVHRISAIHHCRLAAGLIATTPDDVQPDYLRVPDAEIARRSSLHDR
jgi:tRNA threonylcarbamoyladenosine biosynthesis protein TsaB